MTTRLSTLLPFLALLQVPVMAYASETPTATASSETEQADDTVALRERIDWYRAELARQEETKARYNASIARHQRQLEAHRAEEQRIRQEIRKLRKELSLSGIAGESAE